MSLTGNTNEEKIWNFLRTKGLNGYGAAGLMGNLMAESSLNPKNLQNTYEKKLGYNDDTYTKAVDNGSYTNFVKDSAGYGLAQWTYWTRKQNLLDYARTKSKSVGDLECQLEFLWQELSAGYKGVLNVLKAAKTVKEASDCVMLQFERPADQSDAAKSKRASYGQTLYNKYASTATATTTGNGGSKVIRIGHASRPEGGGVNGKAGDQTGYEVCIRTWYSGPWDFMAVYPSESVREKHAKACEAGCKNDHIGYSQFGSDNRNTLNALAKQVNYDLSRVKKDCNTDCSAFQNVCAVASGASGVEYGSNGWTTSTMRGALNKAGYIIVDDPTYLIDASYCVRGAIYVKEGQHTVCGLDNGTNAHMTLDKALTPSSTTVPAAKSQTTTKPQTNSKYTVPIYKVGTVYTTAVELNVRKTPGTSGAKVGHNGLTPNAKANDKDKDGAIDSGTKITCQEVRKIGNDIWIKIPSGWVAAYYQGKIYVK